MNPAILDPKRVRWPSDRVGFVATYEPLGDSVSRLTQASPDFKVHGAVGQNYIREVAYACFDDVSETGTDVLVDVGWGWDGPMVSSTPVDLGTVIFIPPSGGGVYPTYVAKIGSAGSGNDQFNTPRGICGDGTYLYIAEYGNHRIQKRNESDLAYNSKIGSLGTGNDQFTNPWGICTDGTYLYVTEMGGRRLQKRNKSDLAYVAKTGSSGSGNDQFLNPAGIWTDGTYLYICDMSNHRIVKRACSDLAYVSKIGSSGSGDDQFSSPVGICGDGTYLYIGDNGNNRIVKRLASDLSFVAKSSTSNGSGLNQINGPGHIWYSSGWIWMPDGNNRILIYNASTLDHYSAAGVSGSGDEGLVPGGVYRNGDNIFVADDNQRIVKRKAFGVSKIYMANAGGNSIYYTTDGITDPMPGGTLYTSAGVAITGATTIKARASTAQSWGSLFSGTWNSTLSGAAPKPACYVPSCTFFGTLNPVLLVSAFSVYYTTDGSTPDSGDTLYSSGLSISTTTTLKAVAYVGSNASAILTRTFTLAAGSFSYVGQTIDKVGQYGSFAPDGVNDLEWSVTFTAPVGGLVVKRIEVYPVAASSYAWTIGVVWATDSAVYPWNKIDQLSESEDTRVVNANSLIVYEGATPVNSGFTSSLTTFAEGEHTLTMFGTATTTGWLFCVRFLDADSNEIFRAYSPTGN